MAHYGTKSQHELNTAEPDLITLFTEVVKYFDNSIIYAYRDQAIQFELFKKGRELINGIWVITNQNKVVTYKDGYQKLSMHNYSPSMAVDALPYPINYKDTDRMRYFAGFVMGTAVQLKEQGKMTYNIRWGADWDRDSFLDDETFLDFCHFEIIN